MTRYTTAERRRLRRAWDDIIRDLERHGAGDGLCTELKHQGLSHPDVDIETDRLGWCMGQYPGTYFWPIFPSPEDETTTPRILAAVWMRETLDQPWEDNTP